MSGTIETSDLTVKPAPPVPPEPEHPFRGLEEGWVRVPRAPRRSGVAVESVLVIELDPERSAWVFAEAARTGAGARPERVVELLIDAARVAAQG